MGYHPHPTCRSLKPLRTQSLNTGTAKATGKSTGFKAPLFYFMAMQFGASSWTTLCLSFPLVQWGWLLCIKLTGRLLRGASGTRHGAQHTGNTELASPPPLPPPLSRWQLCPPPCMSQLWPRLTPAPLPGIPGLTSKAGESSDLSRQGWGE